MVRCWRRLYYNVLRRNPALPFRFGNRFEHRKDLCEPRAGLLPQGGHVLDGLCLRRGHVVARVLHLCVGSLLGRQGMMQRLYFLLSLLQEGVEQFDACMHFHWCTP